MQIDTFLARWPAIQRATNAVGKLTQAREDARYNATHLTLDVKFITI